MPARLTDTRRTIRERDKTRERECFGSSLSLVNVMKQFQCIHLFLRNIEIVPQGFGILLTK